MSRSEDGGRFYHCLVGKNHLSGSACVHKLTGINAAHWASQEKLAEQVVACGHHLISTIPVQSPAFLGEKVIKNP